jgi:HAD superfamily hydrolase (TIGR01662 family)
MPEPGLFALYRLFIFDADDTLRRTTAPGKPCPHTPDEWALLPGVRETLSRINWDQAGGPRLGLASNQDQVSYGYLSVHMARRLLRDLAISATGSAPPDAAIQLCPHPRELECACRKPKPGMLYAIMSHYGIDPADTLFVGNDEVDREAALRAGTAFIWASDFFNNSSGWLERSRALRQTVDG